MPMNRAGVNMLQVDECTWSCGHGVQGFAGEGGEESGSEESGCEKNGPRHEIYYLLDRENHSKKLTWGGGECGQTYCCIYQHVSIF